jgi:hypothetical protein
MALPVYEMMISPDENSDVEVSFVALVDKPAIEINFLTFKSQQLYFAVDNEKRIISGPAMVADSLIYRKDQNGEYNVFFSAATIKEIALKFAKKGYAKNLNLFHDPALPADGVTIFNSFVSDKSIGIPTMAGFEDLPDGSWFISAKVENEEIWQKIKAGEVKGFSVEGNFSFKKSEQHSENLHLIEKGIMSDLKTWFAEKFAEIKTLFEAAPLPAAAAPAPVAAQAVTAKLTDGTEISVSDMVVGGVVMAGAAPLAAGEYEMEDGTKLSVGEGGVIAALTPKAAGDLPTDYTKEFSAINEKLTGYEQRFSDYETKFTAYEQRFVAQEQAVSNANATIVKLVAIVEKLAETPTADPASQSGSNFTSQKSIDKAQRLMELSDTLKKLKN